MLIHTLLEITRGLGTSQEHFGHVPSLYCQQRPHYTSRPQVMTLNFTLNNIRTIIYMYLRLQGGWSGQ